MKKIIQISLFQLLLAFVFTGTGLAYRCGEDFTLPVYDTPEGMCSCDLVSNEATPMGGNQGYIKYCCGFSYDGECHIEEESEEEEIVTYGCGEDFSLPIYDSPEGMCSCDLVSNEATPMGGNYNYTKYCCGSVQGVNCRIYEDPNTYGCGETNSSATVPDGAICQCEGATWESRKDGLFNWSKGICCGWVVDNVCLSEDPAATNAYCGDTYPTGEKNCICGGSGGPVPMGDGNTCCGWLEDGVCKNTDVGISDIEVSAELLDSLNPLSSGDKKDELSTPGGIISRALSNFIFPIAGIILFAVLLLGGFQMLSGATNSKSLEEGKQRITSAIIGFIILFAAYWIAQLLELIFGIRILS
jgi:hypothetical protein